MGERMRKIIPLSTLAVWLVLGNTVWSACEADTNDRGECDTMYVEPWPGDTLLQGEPPYLVRVSIYVTNDVPDPGDSIAGFIIPLGYTHSNPSKYCSVSAWWNTDWTLWTAPDFSTRSVFRHMVEGTDTLFHNRMADLAADFSGRDWDQRIVELRSDSSWFNYVRYPDIEDSVFLPPHFFLSVIATDPVNDQEWWEGSKVLLATMTFKVEDSMQICMDTCWWPPESHLEWINLDASSKVPRLGTSHDPASYKVCFNLHKPADVREIQDTEEGRASGFCLSQNYPNPFNPYTNFRFTLAKSGHLRIDIFNIVGQQVRTLVDEDMKAGVYVADWDGKNDSGKSVSSGIYFYRMQVGDFSDRKKMLLLK
jgi:hypothetical protein